MESPGFTDAKSRSHKDTVQKCTNRYTKVTLTLGRAKTPYQVRVVLIVADTLAPYPGLNLFCSGLYTPPQPQICTFARPPVLLSYAFGTARARLGLWAG
jgi:hypothetical protein